MRQRTMAFAMAWALGCAQMALVLALLLLPVAGPAAHLGFGLGELGLVACAVWLLRRFLALADAEVARFASIVDRSPQGIVILNVRSDGVPVVDSANDAARMMLGGGLRLERGRTLISALPGLRGTELARRLAQLAGEGGILNEDNFFYESEEDGFSGIFDVLAFPLDASRLVLSLNDVSSRNVLAETVRRRESELGLVFEAVVDAILIGDAAGRYLYANPATCGMTGYTVGELHAMTLSHLLADPSADKLAMLVPQAEDETSGFVEATVRRKDGSQFPAEIVVLLLPDGRQLSLMRDITERKKSEERMRLAAAVFTQAQEAILITNTDGAILQVNDAFCELTGYARSEVIGRTPGLLSSGRHDRAFFAALWAQLLDSGHWAGEIWNRRKNGEEFVQLISISAVRDADGKVSHYIGMSFDITQRKADEMALVKHRDHLQELVAAQVVGLVEAKEEAERANRVKTEFLANMSHELRTPMHAILGFSELGAALPHGQTEKATEYFSLVQRSGQRLLQLIDDLLDLAKLEAGHLVPRRERVVLDRVVEDVLAELEPLAAKQKVKVAYSATEDCTLEAADSAQLGQVVRNLVSNALRFSPAQGTVEVVITHGFLAAPHDGPCLRLTVSDSGPGVPPAELDLIFDKFFQSSRTRNGSGGTGLGLAICREIVALHGGHIAAANRPEGGAIFEVVLPRLASSQAC